MGTRQMLQHGAVLVCTLAAAAPAAARAQAPAVTIADAGPGPVAGLVREALARPHLLVPPAGTPYDLPRGGEVGNSVVILGRDATVAGRVRGDVTIIGGDLFLRPGVEIDGRALAVGGCVYRTTLGVVQGSVRCFRDETFDVTAVDGGYELRWRSLIFKEAPFLAWPGFFGIRMPDYDRVNGLSFGAGPMLTVGRGRLEVEPVLTYRSHLGTYDPDVVARMRLSRRTRLQGWVGRETRSNERWIHSDPTNSLASIWEGKDTRNYYRADGARLTGHQLLEWSTGTLEPYLGAAAERAWSVGPTPETISAPWSVLGRRDREKGMLRPNPGIDRGIVTSALAGAVLDWERAGVRARGSLGAEAAPRSPLGEPFVQTTMDARVDFPTFGVQSFRWDAHVVLTGGAIAPRQRWGWVGGSGTMPMMELLEQGGDNVVFIESRYIVPLPQVRLPLVGSPKVMLRHLLGGAAVGRFPTLEQNVALRVGVKFLRVELVVDPATRETKFRAGLSLSN